MEELKISNDQEKGVRRIECKLDEMEYDKLELVIPLIKTESSFYVLNLLSDLDSDSDSDSNLDSNCAINTPDFLQALNVNPHGKGLNCTITDKKQLLAIIEALEPYLLSPFIPAIINLIDPAFFDEKIHDCQQFKDAGNSQLMFSLAVPKQGIEKELYSYRLRIDKGDHSGPEFQQKLHGCAKVIKSIDILGYDTYKKPRFFDQRMPLFINNQSSLEMRVNEPLSLFYTLKYISSSLDISICREMRFFIAQSLPDYYAEDLLSSNEDFQTLRSENPKPLTHVMLFFHELLCLKQDVDDIFEDFLFYSIKKQDNRLLLLYATSIFSPYEFSKKCLSLINSSHPFYQQMCENIGIKEKSYPKKLEYFLELPDSKLYYIEHRLLWLFLAYTGNDFKLLATIIFAKQRTAHCYEKLVAAIQYCVFFSITNYPLINICYQLLGKITADSPIYQRSQLTAGCFAILLSKNKEDWENKEDFRQKAIMHFYNAYCPAGIWQHIDEEEENRVLAFFKENRSIHFTSLYFNFAQLLHQKYPLLAYQLFRVFCVVNRDRNYRENLSATAKDTLPLDATLQIYQVKKNFAICAIEELRAMRKNVKKNYPLKNDASYNILQEMLGALFANDDCAAQLREDCLKLFATKKSAQLLVCHLFKAKDVEAQPVSNCSLAV